MQVTVLRRNGQAQQDGSLAILHSPCKLAEYDKTGKEETSTLKAAAQVRRDRPGREISSADSRNLNTVVALWVGSTNTIIATAPTAPKKAPPTTIASHRAASQVEQADLVVLQHLVLVQESFSLEP